MARVALEVSKRFKLNFKAYLRYKWYIRLKTLRAWCERFRMGYIIIRWIEWRIFSEKKTWTMDEQNWLKTNNWKKKEKKKKSEKKDENNENEEEVENELILEIEEVLEKLENKYP